MEKMVNVWLFGKKYSVPESLTIMKAMEYAGYRLVRGCGCRNGFCGACSSRCPAGISHPQVALLARRLTGKYLTPESEHLLRRVKEVEDGKYTDAIAALKEKTADELKKLYNERVIEK